MTERRDFDGVHYSHPLLHPRESIYPLSYSFVLDDLVKRVDIVWPRLRDCKKGWLVGKDFIHLDRFDIDRLLVIQDGTDYVTSLHPARIRKT